MSNLAPPSGVAPTHTSPPTLQVHHLQRSQSERILWLLEELGIPYILTLHQRAPLLSPPSLKAITPVGTAPAIQDGPLTLSESMAIATYILTTYSDGVGTLPSGREGAGGTLVVPPSAATKVYTDYLYYLYFVLCSLQPSGSTTMVAYFDKTAPDDGPARSLSRMRFQRNLSIIETRLETSPFLAGDSFTLVDIMAVWVFTTFRVFLPYSLKPYPNILGYVGRMTGREAYRRAMKKGDQGLEVLSGVEPGEKKAVL